MSRRTRRLVIAVAAVLVLAGSGGVVLLLRDRPPGAPGADRPAATTTVTRQTLASRTTVDAELGYGTAVPLASRAAGTLTWLPKVGAAVDRGGTLLRADNRPVVLLYGILPMYRSLVPGTDGPDVAQLERNLRELGYDEFTVDDEYTYRTAAAVRRWQEKLGLPETGAVTPESVVVATGAIRVAGHTGRLGGPATGDVLSYTGATPVVTVQAEADAAGWADPGVPVTVTLPDGRQTPGKVTHVGTKATPKDGDTPTLPVTVRLTDRDALGRLREAPVEVTYTGEERKDVLTVPVAALLALAEGGYGLEVVDPAGSRYLPVDVGLFADGRAEVSGAGLTDGMTVGMAA
ncbi:peptidoglycan-binding protein [Jidongwangia harbinensis]|uniref:peptidoglycan-binding protein n=1 Tax=Jidongwangia harbinensis TaxID=2878561 RepID=UPI001CD9D9C9|nr:peptidoglycan-binding protein [Jidongwangia harbinensis]MCA2217598.1 peptidoglycan-binding protein [Jidongwangia harbinensis]